MENGLSRFSLFGNSSKYIEPAVLNTQLAPVLFPGWTCRFYVDDSVPAEAIQRFKANGAEVIHIDPQLRNWPGTMWRFLAINDPEAEYVIFRDADSIICYRDAASVSEWIKKWRPIPHHTRFGLAYCFNSCRYVGSQGRCRS